MLKVSGLQTGKSEGASKEKDSLSPDLEGKSRGAGLSGLQLSQKKSITAGTCKKKKGRKTLLGRGKIQLEEILEREPLVKGEVTA